VVSPVTIEAIEPARKTQSPNTLCKTITPGMAEFEALAADLQVAEEHAVVMTSTMWQTAPT
jgi:hypothetical protein